MLMWTMAANETNCTIDHDLDQRLFPVVYITVIMIGVPANLASLFVSCLQIKKKNELGVYLFNLCLADLMYTLVLPLWVDYVLHHDSWRFSAGLCTLSAFLMHTNFYASSGFLTCISVDRYLAVVHPMKFHQLRTRRTAVCFCLLVWSVEISSNSAIFFYQQTSNDTEKHLLCYEIYPMEHWRALFNISRMCVGFFLPLVIMAFCYQRLHMAVKRNQATTNVAKLRIRKLLITILVTFFLCFSPYHVLLLMRSIWEPGSCTFARSIFNPYKITLALASLNCIADPILYCFVSETSRRDIGTLVKCCGQDEPQTPEKQDLEMSPISNKITLGPESVSRPDEVK
ncbi:psychosine receptor [Ambystoma mexicanum]|uniref:psychosine receptor n=1 Tax=Ambystoma mexicanum TaxID=8296 RepID=UPI0037E77473